MLLARLFGRIEGCRGLSRSSHKGYNDAWRGEDVRTGVRGGSKRDGERGGGGGPGCQRCSV